SEGLDLRDLPHWDATKDDRRPDMQALDGAIKEQDIGQLFSEEFPATEEQHPGDYTDDGADDKGADHGWTDLTSHDVSFSLPAWPWAPGAGLPPRWWRPPPRA